MSTNRVLWIVLSAARILAVGPAAGEAWQTVEQPELKEALERAPVLPTESLGEPARGVNVWERWLVPNPDGKSWDVLQIYFKEYYGPTWLYAVDLGTGQVTKQRLADGHQFYLSGRALGFDGKYYIATPSRKTWSMDLFVYDPATNTVQERGEIVPGLGGEVRPLVTGPDGRIYGTGTRDNRVGLYIYDPKLGKVVKDFGPAGPSHPNGAWSRYVMGVDDTHAYIASGMIPAWYLVAVDLATGEQKVLLESPTERVMDIIESFPGAYARVPQDGGAPDREYWLYHGQAIPKTNDTPPWPKQASPWDKAVPRPEVYFDQIDPDAQGNAVLWYRSREDAAKAPKNPPHDAEPRTLGWKSVRLEGVPSYPHRLNPMSILPEGRLYGTGDDYAGVFTFDPRTDQTTILGPRPGLAPYTQITCGGKLYSSGYSGGHLFVYDPTQPWTLSIGGPPGHPSPNQAEARSNPRYLGDFDKTTRVGLMHSSALGADGRIYFGGFGLRHYTGGGLGWWDPKTQKMDGFWKPLSGYAVQWITSALDGRLIVISTIRAADELNGNRMPEEAKLFVYDVREQKIVREIVPVRKGRTTGLVAEVQSGRLLGLTSDTEHSDRSILYGVDVTTGEALFTKGLPSSVSIDKYWPHWVDPSYEYNAFVRGPDGFVWTYLKDVLVRIDPKDARVHVVGRIDPVGWPTFAGNDVYFSGPEQLRRVRNVIPASGRKLRETGPAEESAKTGNRADGEPLFRFLQMADTHVYAGPPHPTNHCALANKKMKWIVETVGRGKHFPVPDFVIHSGDMIDGEPQSAGVKLLGPDLELFREMIQSLGCPFHPCLGNHENQQQEGDAVFERPYREAFGAGQDNYVFRHGGIRFVVFNNSGAPDSNSGAGKARNQWLRQTLDAAPEEPTILCCHIPLIPLRDEQVLNRSFGFKSYTAHDGELLEIVEAHADSVVAVLSGHLHLTGVVRRNGIYHIVPSGSATYPCDYGALFTVFRDHIKVQMQSLPRELAAADGNTIGFQGSIHGKPRHDQDFVDGGHPTAQLYQCGRRDEREFEIPLSGKKSVTNRGTTDVFVSPQGRDNWSGKLADPGENDGPLATMARAREAVRALRQTQKEPRCVRVVLRGGTYYLDSPLEFGPEDSGTEQAPAVYCAAAGERVVLSGGRRLENGRWGEVNGRKAWVVDIAEVKAGTWRFRQLFVNGERRPRTRLPKNGEYRIESLPGYTGDFLRSPTRQFVYTPGDIVPTWRNLPDVEVVGITRWLDNRLPIESVKAETRTVTFDRASLFALVAGSQPGVYWVENVFEALDTPGQWYLDRPRGTLYYLPRAGEEMSSAEIIAPRLAQVVRVVGRAGAPVHDLRFEGLVFAHTEWQPPADYASSLQAGIEVPGALLFDYAERCAVTGGGIEHIGNYGVEVGVGCADIEIAHNRITDIGAGGIRIGHFFSWETDGSGRLTERGIRRKAAMPQGPHSRRITVADNEIAHGGRFTPEAAGVFVGDNADNRIIHNHIYDLFYSGISVGSVQDFGPSEARGNIIEYNHVHDIGQGLLSDLAGIYTCSTPGSRLAYNIVHDVVRRDYGGWGIYPDEGSHDMAIEKNLVYRCQDGALFAHHNQNITAENNIFAFNRRAQVERGGIGGFELTFRRNLVYYLEGKAVGDYGSAHCGRDICVFDRNLYWNASGKPVLFASKSFSEWQATGQDKDSLIADPLFVDPAHGDFTLRPGSPAAQIGFEPWDMGAIQ